MVNLKRLIILIIVSIVGFVIAWNLGVLLGKLLFYSGIIPLLGNFFDSITFIE